ncbi:DUF317 domain-containing protein [Streptomyces sp. NPDC001228]|uniref:DUF317 domain-containing protein n=1 Tax=Streptomyces sp. NPDC001228 TaxID=3154381 RepID=UPI0033274906
MVLPLIEDADPCPDLVSWQAWADPVSGTPYLWCASFSASVPHGLVALFAPAPTDLCQDQRRGARSAESVARGGVMAWRLVRWLALVVAGA